MITSNQTVTNGPLYQLSRGAWQSLLAIGIISVLTGMIVLVWPGPTLVVAGILFGAYLMASGILQAVAAFGPQVSGGWRAMSLISGILSFILAFFCLRDIGSSIVLLALWVGISAMFRGIAALAGGAEASSRMPGRGWAVFYGVLLLLGGIALVVWPIHSIARLTLVVGCWLVVMGIVEIVHAFQVRSAAKRIPAEL
ncbi:DUF308 domain-containing protein [Nocardia ninae]|uniref:Membrane protein n=1 Tax=Nocardia ninae NBRC 108245 TaxID=1210091 RepID=A0A511MJZ0_9NOCA|nr:DUF308 domain-containing protein [Nocardia ninae]GEM40447.1 membrane protein [Nocardia ninae NBRC 108245]